MKSLPPTSNKFHCLARIPGMYWTIIDLTISASGEKWILSQWIVLFDRSVFICSPLPRDCRFFQHVLFTFGGHCLWFNAHSFTFSNQRNWGTHEKKNTPKSIMVKERYPPVYNNYQARPKSADTQLKKNIKVNKYRGGISDATTSSSLILLFKYTKFEDFLPSITSIFVVWK